MLRECGMIRKSPVYLLCTVIFPLFVTIFFTSLMNEGQPQEMPVGVVDLDNSGTTRAIIRRLDGMQTSHVVAHYPSVSEARRAIQHGDIYAFLYIPEGTTEKLLSSRAPTVSFYYSNTSLTAGALLFRDLKTVTTLAGAAVGQATLRAKGFTDKQAMTFLRPIALDAHLINNPTTSYNLYLSTMLIPASIMLFIMILTAYSAGMELKQGSGKELLQLANGNIFIALAGKMLPQTLLFLSLMYVHAFYIFGVLGFTHEGGILWILGLGLLTVLAGQGFGLAVFGMMPSMRMAISICSLWSVLSFSMIGAAFPAFAMDAPLEALAWLFPMRHYWLIYALNIFNGYPMADSWPHIAALLLFALLPLLVIGRIKKAFEQYVYIK
ncbi:MAG: ABC transporter permease [Bacteroidales bacterium]|nr:ABC transporter permease [Bacteroidales bacterium]MCM1146423.1 ABC transporter permease [Bacteroidales bacterium]MCM1205139.1 ABC transporter permease [Bacillota bacterium]